MCAARTTAGAGSSAVKGLHVLTTELDNNTQLAWEPPKGFPVGASYEVVWRDTSAPTWTNMEPIGTKTSVTLPISKDNTIFGVRSVDAAGHRSPAVYPWPTRMASIPRPASSPK